MGKGHGFRTLAGRERLTAYVDFEKRANFWRDVGGAAKRGGEVSLYVRDDDNNIRKAEEDESFFTHPHIRTFRVPNPHAKIYFNERVAVLGSVNLVAASFETSGDSSKGLTSWFSGTAGSRSYRRQIILR